MVSLLQEQEEHVCTSRREIHLIGAMYAINTIHQLMCKEMMDHSKYREGKIILPRVRVVDA